MILPVPRYGRGLGILTYICERLPETDIFADRHFMTELGHMDATALWVRPQVQDMLAGKFIRAIPEDFVALGVYFVCDPQLDDIWTRKLIRRLLICGGRVIFTGTVEPNTHASLLLHAGKAKLLRYSVHCTQAGHAAHRVAESFRPDHRVSFGLRADAEGLRSIKQAEPARISTAVWNALSARTVSCDFLCAKICRGFAPSFYKNLFP